MKQATNQQQETSPVNLHLGQRLREALLITSLAISLFLFLSLISYHISDPGWSTSGLSAQVKNMGGKAGAWFADLFLYVFGYMAYLFPLMLAYAAYLNFRGRGEQQEKSRHILLLKCIGFVGLVAAGCGLGSLHFSQYHQHVPYTTGGIIGSVIANYLVSVFNSSGATLLLLALLACSITLFNGLSWSQLTQRMTLALKSGLLWIHQKLQQVQEASKLKRAEKQRQKALEKAKPKIMRAEPKVAKPSPAPTPTKPKAEPKPAISQPVTQIKQSDRDYKERQMSLLKTEDNYKLPTLSLLDRNTKAKQHALSKAALEAQSDEVEQRLLDFGVDARVVAVHPGPVITRFELELAPGVKVSKISGLAKDLARSLSTVSVRVVEVIPGKSVIGLELPNEHREVVRLREVLESQRYDQARSPLSLALGKDIAGHPVVVDIAKMPHLLVAGTTGSGKSVSLNAMLLSLLYKASPAEVRMILVDPKMLELSIYEGIPHLLTPVVTDMKEAANALRWCVAEMDRRYRLMAHLGVRNLAGFNQKILDANKAKQPIPDPLRPVQPGEEPFYLETLPFIVVLIDEFADMIMVVGKKVEELIARIAQKARAAGIHLILATQRPSVDVITGLIKANIPTRVAFQVSSKVDSRTIIDQQGAETLLGHGDMLYLPPGTGVPIRVHGAFVADDEVHKVVGDLKKQAQPQYLSEILEGPADSGSQDPLLMAESDGEQDPIYDQAVEFVTQSRKVSISSIQRRFKIGYNRAARIVEDMEQAGVVSTMEGNGSREVLAPPPPED